MFWRTGKGAEVVEAVVQKVITEGKHGPYVVTKAEGFDSSITFSLEPNVWLEETPPESGERVLLCDLRPKRAGWRAKKARRLSPCDEQTERSNDMRMLAALWERLRARIFASENDSLWREWVNCKERKMMDLVGLLDQEVSIDFKKRALFLLLVPEKSWNRVYWPHELCTFGVNNSFLATLPAELLDYTADLILDFGRIVRGLNDPTPPPKVTPMGPGMTMIIPRSSKYYAALGYYNGCILQFLGSVLAEERKEGLFGLYSLNDIDTFWNMDEASGYNPFGFLLGLAVDEKWKKRADQEMREIIRAELAGERKPRKDWEDALSQYADKITIQLYGHITYSFELFASQIGFLVSLRDVGKRRIISSFYVPKLLGLFSAEEYKPLRQALARFVVLVDGDRFWPYSDELMELAQKMLQEFGEEDPELKVALEQAIERGRQHIATRKEAERKASEPQPDPEKDILARMKG